MWFFKIIKIKVSYMKQTAQFKKKKKKKDFNLYFTKEIDSK